MLKYTKITLFRTRSDNKTQGASILNLGIWCICNKWDDKMTTKVNQCTTALCVLRQCPQYLMGNFETYNVHVAASHFEAHIQNTL